MKIGSLELTSPLVLAPMAGFTDTCTRRLARRYGAGLVHTEMVSAAGLVRREPRTLELLSIHPEEHPCAVQLFGADPAEMAEAARIAHGLGAATVDINMGCPVKRVCRTGAGASLLRDPRRVARILDAVRKAVPCPLTVKMRLGWDERNLSVLEISRIAEEAGTDAISLHGRTRVQGFRDRADWTWVARLKQERRIPVIGNGDLRTGADCLEALRTTSCDAVMVGRASRGNPWIFAQAQSLLSGRPCPEPSVEVRYRTIMLHMDWLLTRYGRERGMRRMRFLLFHYSRGLPHAARFRERLAATHGNEGIENLLKEYFLARHRAD